MTKKAAILACETVFNISANPIHTPIAQITHDPLELEVWFADAFECEGLKYLTVHYNEKAVRFSAEEIWEALTS